MLDLDGGVHQPPRLTDDARPSGGPEHGTNGVGAGKRYAPFLQELPDVYRAKRFTPVTDHGQRPLDLVGEVIVRVHRGITARVRRGMARVVGHTPRARVIDPPMVKVETVAAHVKRGGRVLGTAATATRAGLRVHIEKGYVRHDATAVANSASNSARTPGAACLMHSRTNAR